MTDKGKKRKNIDGKAFMKSLMAGNNSKEVFDLLGQTLGSERMKDRAKNISDLPAIVKLNAVKAKINVGNGSDVSHQNCMDMAVAKYCELTGNSIQQFKIENNKYATQIAANEKQVSISTKAPTISNTPNDVEFNM